MIQAIGGRSSTMRMWKRFVVVVVGLMAIVAAGAIAFSAANAVGSTARPTTPVVLGGHIVSQGNDQIVFQITGPAGPGKFGGSTITTRVTSSTRFSNVPRTGVGPSLPLAITIDAQPNPDRTFDLLSVEAQVR